MTDKNLIIPVYLNQRLVFDLLAMLQDGISTITRVSSSEEITNKDNQTYGAKFGLNAALSSLFKIDVSGDKTKTDEKSTGIQRAEERVHTPASLFFKLRELLIKENILKVTDKDYIPISGQIIEFKTSLRRNPLIHTMDTMIRLIDIGTAFLEEHQKNTAKKQGPSEIQKMRKQMGIFLEGLKAGGTIDIIGDKLENSYTSVITLEHEYLNDPTMSDLVDGQFSVMGKIIRVITDPSNSISLIRKASISAMPSNILTQFISNLSEMKDIKIPPIELEIKGPVVQMIPIAIFT